MALRLWRRKDKPPKLSELPTLMLKELVKAYYSGERDSYGIRISEVGMRVVGLARKAGLELRYEKQASEAGIEKGVYLTDDWKADLDAAIREMEEGGWVRLIGSDADTAVMPTKAGRKHGGFLNRPWWYRRLIHPFSGDVRTLIIGAVSGAGAAILATLVLKLLGWIG